MRHSHPSVYGRLVVNSISHMWMHHQLVWIVGSGRYHSNSRRSALTLVESLPSAMGISLRELRE